MVAHAGEAAAIQVGCRWSLDSHGILHVPCGAVLVDAQFRPAQMRTDTGRVGPVSSVYAADGQSRARTIYSRAPA